MDSAIQRLNNPGQVNNAIHWIAQLVSLILIHWIVVFPMDSAIQLFNNWGLKDRKITELYYPFSRGVRVIGLLIVLSLL